MSIIGVTLPVSEISCKVMGAVIITVTATLRKHYICWSVQTIIEISCCKWTLRARNSNSNDIRGITVDNEEIKVGSFWDYLTGFLKDDLSLTNFRKLKEDYGTCFGLTVITMKSLSFCCKVTESNPYKDPLWTT